MSQQSGNLRMHPANRAFETGLPTFLDRYSTATSRHSGYLCDSDRTGALSAELCEAMGVVETFTHVTRKTRRLCPPSKIGSIEGNPCSFKGFERRGT